MNLLVIDPYNFIERSQEGRGGDENVGRGHTLGTGFGNCLWFGDLTWMLTESERPGIQHGGMDGDLPFIFGMGFRLLRCSFSRERTCFSPFLGGHSGFSSSHHACLCLRAFYWKRQARVFNIQSAWVSCLIEHSKAGE